MDPFFLHYKQNIVQVATGPGISWCQHHVQTNQRLSHQTKNKQIKPASIQWHIHI